MTDDRLTAPGSRRFLAGCHDLTIHKHVRALSRLLAEHLARLEQLLEKLDE